jgi:hypothetical protein
MYSWIGKRQNGTTVRWSSIASGAEDAVIDAEAGRIAAMSVPVFFNWFLAAGATNAIWTVVYMGVISDNKLAMVKALYHGDVYVDRIAWHPYDWGACRSQPWVSFADTVSPFYNWLQANGSSTSITRCRRSVVMGASPPAPPAPRPRQVRSDPAAPTSIPIPVPGVVHNATPQPTQ